MRPKIEWPDGKKRQGRARGKNGRASGNAPQDFRDVGKVLRNREPQPRPRRSDSPLPVGTSELTALN
jgi:hypothetical protein